MGSNGLTSARHDVFGKYLATKYPESYDNAVPDELVYSGTLKLTDKIAELGIVAGKLYVIELKLGRSAEAAMAQINLKQYPERFSLSGLQVVKVGINFDVEKHTLGDWVIEE